MKLGILQLNPWVGDIAGNKTKILEKTLFLFEQGAELVITPELAICGYPPRDLLLRKKIVQKCMHGAKELAQSIPENKILILGCPWLENGQLYNAALVIQGGKIIHWTGKTLLPNYDVFDEQRYFTPFAGNKVIKLKQLKIGLTVCEDIWNDKEFWRKPKYPIDPVAKLAQENIDLLINLSASPFSVGKQEIKEQMLKHLHQKYAFPLVYVNQVGANDDLIFAGQSMIFNHGQLIFKAKAFEEEITIVELNPTPPTYPLFHLTEDIFSPEEEIFKALCLGVKDYVRKCGFKKVVLGISGGIDSALTATIASSALGPENVLGILLPSCFTSKESQEDALALAKNLKIQIQTISIEEIRQSFSRTLGPIFKNLPPDVTEENIQARIRGNLLMAISNKFGYLLLTTGNKSELAVGYCTIYGDMAGGLAVISDLPKTMVYQVCAWLNNPKEIIPKRILQKPPSAELRPNQTDQDSLPPYPILDQILELIIEQNLEPEEIITLGYEAKLVNQIYQLVRKAEFKRKQAPPGLKVTDRAFGTGWRMPIAAKV